MAQSGGISSSIRPDTSDGIAVSDSTGTERVRIGLLDASNPTTGDYGIKVTSSDGSTVIIDGTSNMFKIIASGTFTITGPAASASATASVTVATGLSYGPSFESYIELVSTFADRIPYNIINSSQTLENILAYTYSPSAGNSRMTVEWRTGSSGGAYSTQVKTVRYYFLKEVAI